MDEGRARLLDAERRLFARYDLDVRQSFVELADPPMRVRVLETGDGPPLVLVDGGGGTAAAFAPLMAHLHGFRVLCLERPGNGLSDGFDYHGVDVRRHAVAFLESGLNALGLRGPVPLLANSMGGLWTFFLSLERPERASALIQLGCPALILDTSAPLSMRVLSVPGMTSHLPSEPRWGRRAIEHIAGPRAAERIPQELVECVTIARELPTRLSTRVSLIQSTLRLRGKRQSLTLGEEDLARVTQPVLFLWGEDDDYGKPESGRRACQVMPDARLEILPAGHLPWLDEPEWCARSLSEFLQDRASQDHPVVAEPDRA